MLVVDGFFLVVELKTIFLRQELLSDFWGRTFLSGGAIIFSEAAWCMESFIINFI